LHSVGSVGGVVGVGTSAAASCLEWNESAQGAWAISSASSTHLVVNRQCSGRRKGIGSEYCSLEHFQVFPHHF
jgi:hypothetical protein